MWTNTPTSVVRLGFDVLVLGVEILELGIKVLGLGFEALGLQSRHHPKPSARATQPSV